MATTSVLLTPIRFAYDKTSNNAVAILPGDVYQVIYDFSISGNTVSYKESDGRGGFTQQSVTLGSGRGATTVQGSPISIGIVLPSNPSSGAFHLYNADAIASTINTFFSFDGTTPIVNIFNGDWFQYDGTKWVLKFREPIRKITDFPDTPSGYGSTGQILSSTGSGFQLSNIADLIGYGINASRINAGTLNIDRIADGSITEDKLDFENTPVEGMIAVINASLKPAWVASSTILEALNATNITTGTLNTARIASESIELSHLEIEGTPTGTKVIGYDTVESKLKWVENNDPTATAYTQFINLTDTPANYTGANDQFVKVNLAGSRIEFADIEASDVPNLSASKITSGTLDVARIGDNSVTVDKLRILGTPEASGSFITHNTGTVSGDTITFLSWTSTLNADNITLGTLNALRLGDDSIGVEKLEITGTETEGYLLELRANKLNWVSPPAGVGSSINADNINSGTLDIARIADGSIGEEKLEIEGNPSSNSLLSYNPITSNFKWNTASSTYSFLGLSDTPSTYTGQALKNLRVNSAENAIEFGSDNSSFTGLSDTPPSILANKWVKGNSLGTALEFVDGPTGGGATTFLALTDTPSAYGTAGQIPAMKSDLTGIEWISPSSGSGGSSTFAGLTDTPSSSVLTNSAGKVLTVLRDGKIGLENRFPISFLELADTPDIKITGAYLRGSPDDGHTLVWDTTPPSGGSSSTTVITTFTGLTDTPSQLGMPFQIARVNSDRTAIEFADPESSDVGGVIYPTQTVNLITEPFDFVGFDTDESPTGDQEVVLFYRSSNGEYFFRSNIGGFRIIASFLYVYII